MKGLGAHEDSNIIHKTREKPQGVGYEDSNIIHKSREELRGGWGGGG